MVMEKRRLRRDQNPLAVDSAHRIFSYVDRGRYERQVDTISSLTRNLMVIGFTDLVTSPGEVINAVFKFLGLEPLPSPDLPSLNAGTEKAWLPGRWMALHKTRGFPRIFPLFPTRPTEAGLSDQPCLSPTCSMEFQFSEDPASDKRDCCRFS